MINRLSGCVRSAIVPSAILGELDYLLHEHLGIQAEIDFIESLISGAFTLENLTSEDVTRCHELIKQVGGSDQAGPPMH